MTFLSSMGYIARGLPGGKQVQEHNLIAGRILGRPIKKPVEVHHVNENRADNRPENLVICPSREYHMLLHVRMRALAASGHVDWRKCKICKQWDDPKNLKFYSLTGVIHLKCHRDKRRSKRK